MNLVDCRDQWHFNSQYRCWCLEDVVYTDSPTNPEAQRLSVFVPEPFMSAPGVIAPGAAMGSFTAQTAPVIFENNSAGYRQMANTPLGDFRDESAKYLARGMVYVTCGCRGRESVDREGRLCAKSPWTLVDLKMAIRFLRHNAAALPGDFSKVISVGWSAGGAMSALLGVTGNNTAYDPFLKKNGAFMAESDAVLAAQIYCPITDLEHADAAYEWQFRADAENEASFGHPAGTMTAFQSALSAKLSAHYMDYFNGLALRHPETGDLLTIGADGRSGTGYEYLMLQLERSATDYLTRLAAGKLEESFSVEDYLAGRYSRQTSRLRRTAEGFAHDLIEIPGKDKHSWLRWDGEKAQIDGLDAYVLNHRRRMKPCTAFDALNCSSPENQELGRAECDRMHFSADVRKAVETLCESFPEETPALLAAFADAAEDTELKQRCALINPMNFIGQGAEHYRIRVGACDADTSFSVSMVLALALANAGKDVDYALVWDRPHCEADYPGEVCDWIESLCEYHN
ncbi:MAG: hypothetical protein IJH38_02715 [Clostridia bacterium]|nr:hypothetical protein [Clostridia bacterium]